MSTEKRDLKTIISKWTNYFNQTKEISFNDILQFHKELGHSFNKFDEYKQLFEKIKLYNYDNENLKEMQSVVEFAAVVYDMINELIETEGMNFNIALKTVAAYYQVSPSELSKLLFFFQNILMLIYDLQYGLSNPVVISINDTKIKRITALTDYKNIIEKIKNYLIIKNYGKKLQKHQLKKLGNILSDYEAKIIIEYIYFYLKEKYGLL